MSSAALLRWICCHTRARENISMSSQGGAHCKHLRLGEGCRIGSSCTAGEDALQRQESRCADAHSGDMRDVGVASKAWNIRSGVR